MEVLAFDLGGTRLKAGVVDAATGTVKRATTAPTGGDAEAAFDAVRAAGRELIGDRCPDGVGLSVPGLVDDGGRVVSLPGKFDGIVGRDLPQVLSQVFGAPAVVCNDAIAYGIGEAVYGAGRGGERVLVMTIGTGVGVTVLERGQRLGAGPLGGGILGGQIPYSEETGPTDTSGRQGTIEARCAAARILDGAGGKYETVEELYDGFDREEEAAIEAVEAYQPWLVRAIVALTHAHAPDVFVLGGGPMHERSPLLAHLQPRVDERLWPGVAVDIRLAQLGDHAALAGVARLYAGAAA